MLLLILNTYKAIWDKVLGVSGYGNHFSQSKLYPVSKFSYFEQDTKSKKKMTKWILFYALPCVSALSERTAISFHSSQRN